MSNMQYNYNFYSYTLNRLISIQIHIIISCYLPMRDWLGLIRLHTNVVISFLNRTKCLICNNTTEISQLERSEFIGREKSGNYFSPQQNTKRFFYIYRIYNCNCAWNSLNNTNKCFLYRALKRQRGYFTCKQLLDWLKTTCILFSPHRKGHTDWPVTGNTRWAVSCQDNQHCRLSASSQMLLRTLSMFSLVQHCL